MKRRTFISLMGVMAAAGVLSLTGCSSKDTAASTASSAPLNKLDSIQKSGKLTLVMVHMRGTDLDAANLKEELQRMRLGSPLQKSKKRVGGKPRPR